MTELSDHDAVGQAELVRGGEVSPIELVDDAIARIEKLNPELNAVIHPLFDKARDAAGGDLPDGPFRGVPMVLKDLDGHSAGDPFHCGMRVLKDINWIEQEDSNSHAKLRSAGFVFVGKTNCPELGLIPTTEPLSYGATKNPWDTTRSTGGSSGGSAAAVAARMVAIGSAGDGGGSIRIPASECGLVGLKPTRGRVSLGPDGEPWHGLVHRGAVTRSVRDSAAVLDVMSGYVAGDPYSAPPPERPFADEVGRDPGKLRIGLSLTPAADLGAVEPEVEQAVLETGRLLESLGHTVEESHPVAFDDPRLVEHGGPLIASWAKWEVEDWSRKIGREIKREELEPATQGFLDFVAGVSGSDYIHAIEELHHVVRAAAKWWEDYDLLLTPTIPMVPLPLGSFDCPPDNPFHAMGVAMGVIPFVVPFNITGQPAISLPLHWTDEGLPVGVQLAAEYAREDLLIRIASQLEEASPWADRRPPLS